MSDFESAAKIRVGADLVVNARDRSAKITDRPRRNTDRREILGKLIPELGSQINKREPPTQRVIDHRKTPVGGIHRPDDVKIVRNIKTNRFILCVGKFDRVFLAALVRLDQHHEFAEDFTQIFAIDLVDNHEKLAIRMRILM